MQEPKVMGIFPLPFYMINLKDEFSNIDVASLLSHDKKHNTDNSISSNKYILEDNLEVKNIIQRRINDLFYRFLEEDRETTQLYITQSWLNYTEPGEKHHRHSHPNSVISGALYLNCDDYTGSFNIFNPRIDLFPRLFTKKKSYDIEFNYERMWFTPEPYDLYLFPSFLEHNVSENRSSITRISLAFNTFLKGKLGEYDYATELNI